MKVDTVVPRKYVAHGNEDEANLVILLVVTLLMDIHVDEVVCGTGHTDSSLDEVPVVQFLSHD